MNQELYRREPTIHQSIDYCNGTNQVIDLKIGSPPSLVIVFQIKIQIHARRRVRRQYIANSSTELDVRFGKGRQSTGSKHSGTALISACNDE